MNRITLYTDGACSGNPGPGGWGCVVILGETCRSLSGFDAATTNNRMELSGVIYGLEALLRPCAVTVFTDSQYVKNAFTENWLTRWEANGWRTASKEPVKNQDLWLRLAELKRLHALQWEWVKGHSGNVFNEWCDQLAREAIKRRSGVDERSTVSEVKALVKL